MFAKCIIYFRNLGGNFAINVKSFFFKLRGYNTYICILYFVCLIVKSMCMNKVKGYLITMVKKWKGNKFRGR